MSSNVILSKMGLSEVRAWTPHAIEDSRSIPETLVTAPALVPLAEQGAKDLLSPEADPEAMDRARAEAYALGLAEGRKQAEERGSYEREALLALISTISKLRQDLEKNLADEVLSLGLEIAKLMVREALALKPEAVLSVLREAMGALPGLSQQTVLHLHPADAALVKPLLATDPILAQNTWKVTEDPRIERGGCRLETSQSEVDATLATRWSRLVSALGREDSWRTESKG